jgi:hypothetical protein
MRLVRIKIVHVVVRGNRNIEETYSRRQSGKIVCSTDAVRTNIRSERREGKRKAREERRGAIVPMVNEP